MAATNVFLSGGAVREQSGIIDDDALTTGTSSSSTHFVELRVMTVDGSSVATGITIADVRKTLEAFERWLDNGGALGADTTLPVM